MILIVRSDPAQVFIELGTVVVFMDMNEFMQNQVVNVLRWQEDDPPMKEQLALLSAGPPTKTEILHSNILDLRGRC